MGEVGNAAPCSSPRGIDELDEAIKDNKIFGRDGKEEVDIDGSIREEPSIGQKESVDRSGGSDDRDELDRA